MTEEEDSYVKQLHSLFRSCDSKGDGLLAKDELFQLCSKLQLDERQTFYMLDRLIGDDFFIRVDFDEFKEAFVDLLVQNNSSQSTHDTTSNQTALLSSSSPLVQSPPSASPKSHHQSPRECSSSSPGCSSSTPRGLKGSTIAGNKNSVNSHEVGAGARRMQEGETLGYADASTEQTASMSTIEAYLKSIWDQLGVGKNGYLNVTDLKLVCNGIGMSEMNDEMVNQLFASLDTDQDGMVSFNELLQGMFRQQQMQDISLSVEEVEVEEELLDESMDASSIDLERDVHSGSASTDLLTHQAYSGNKSVVKEGSSSSKESSSQSPAVEEEESVNLLALRKGESCKRKPGSGCDNGTKEASASTVIYDCPSSVAGPNAEDFTSSLYLHSFDVAGNGLVQVDTLYSFWQSHGLYFAPTVLKDLGLTGPLVSIHRLSIVLEEELSSSMCDVNSSSNNNRHHESPAVISSTSSSITSLTGSVTQTACRPAKIPSISLSRDNRNIASGKGGRLFQMALVTFLHELHYSRSMYKQVQEERDRLRASMAEANLRADLLAQEVELDHKQLEELSYNKIACLERKTQEKIRALEEELSKEREAFAQKLDQMKAEYERNRATLEAHEAKLREQLESLEKENKRMESEMQNLATRFCELEKLNCILQSELESDSYRKKMEDTDPMQILLSEQQYKHLLQQLEEAKRHSKESQDLNDELVLEVERLKKHIDKMELSARTYAHDKGFSKRLKDGSFKYDSSSSSSSKRGPPFESESQLAPGKAVSEEEDMSSIQASNGMAVDLMPGCIGDMEDASSFYASGPFTSGVSGVGGSGNSSSGNTIPGCTVTSGGSSSSNGSNCGSGSGSEDICLVKSVKAQMAIGRVDHMTTFDFDPHYQSCCKSSPSSLPSLPVMCQERENSFPRTHSLDVFDCRSQLSQRVKQILQAHIGCKCEPLQQVTSQCASSVTSVTRQRTKEEISLMADEITKVLMSMPWHEDKESKAIQLDEGL